MTETDDDWLERALREDAREGSAYVADEGFTERVMRMLPPPATMPSWRKPALVGLWAAAGLGAAFALPGTFADLAHEAFRLAAQPFSLPQVAAGVVSLAVVTWTLAAWTLRQD